MTALEKRVLDDLPPKLREAIASNFREGLMIAVEIEGKAAVQITELGRAYLERAGQTGGAQ